MTEGSAQEALGSGQLTYSPQLSVNSVPLPRRTRSQSTVSEFPPPMRRVSNDSSRPVPFAAKFQRVHPGTTGVTVLEHLERLDAVEASLKRLGREESVIEEEEEEEEVDVAESSTRPRKVTPGAVDEAPTSPFSPPGSPLPTVPEIASSANSIVEEDLVAMSKSMSHAEVSSSSSHFRWSNRNTHSNERGLNHDWMRGEDSTQKRVVIAEVRISLAAYAILLIFYPACSDWK